MQVCAPFPRRVYNRQLQERIMTVSFGEHKQRFTWSVFLVLCNRLMTSMLAAGVLAVSISPSNGKVCMG